MSKQQVVNKIFLTATSFFAKKVLTALFTLVDMSANKSTHQVSHCITSWNFSIQKL